MIGVGVSRNHGVVGVIESIQSSVGPPAERDCVQHVLAIFNAAEGIAGDAAVVSVGGKQGRNGEAQKERASNLLRRQVIFNSLHPIRVGCDAGAHGIATLVMRNKEYLVAIRPEDDVLALHTMYFSDEVRDPGRDLELPETGDVTDRELSMAQLLIESMESDWDPERFHDTHREKVEAIIDEKRQGHEIVLQEGPEPVAKVVDLMEALNASIAAAAKNGSESKPAKRTTAKRTTAKRAAPPKKAAKATKAPARAKTASRRKAS